MDIRNIGKDILCISCSNPPTVHVIIIMNIFGIGWSSE